MTPTPKHQIWKVNLCDAVLGGIMRTRHMKAFTWRSVLDELESRKLQHCSLELSNGRCPGCDYITAHGISYKHVLHPLGVQRCYIWLYRVANVYSYRRGLWRCLFDYNRQCESLSSWNGQQDDSTLFYVLLEMKESWGTLKRISGYFRLVIP